MPGPLEVREKGSGSVGVRFSSAVMDWPDLLSRGTWRCYHGEWNEYYEKNKTRDIYDDGQ